MITQYLLKLVGNHGKGLKDGIRRACDCYDPLRAVALGDVYSCATLGEKTCSIIA